MKTKTIYDKIDQLAPFKYTDKFDNTGLLIGDMDSDVNFVVLCLDVTSDIIAETLKIGSGGLIISHHPTIFNPLKNIKSGSIVQQMVKNDITYIAAHTNYDVSAGGITDQMADLLQLENTGEPLEFVCEEVVLDRVKNKEVAFDEINGKEISNCNGITNCNGKNNAPITNLAPEHSVRKIGYGKVCNCEITAENLIQLVQKKFKSVALKHNMNPNSRQKIIRKVGIMSGSGGQLWQDAMEKNCDALIVGESKHNHITDAYNADFLLIEAGHYETEIIGMKKLKNILTKEFENIPVHFIDKKFIFGNNID